MADILVVRGNPLEDIRNTRNIEMVVMRGKIQDRTYHAGYANPIPRNPRGYPTNPPVPVVESISPFFATEGDTDLTVTVRGRFFHADNYVKSIAKLGGTSLETTFVSGTELKAVIPEHLLKRVGNDPVTVYTPPNWGSGGGESVIVGYDDPVYFMVKFKP